MMSGLKVVGDGAQDGRDLRRIGRIFAAAQRVGQPIEQLDEVLNDGHHLIGLLPLRLRDRRWRFEHTYRERLVTATTLGHAELNALPGPQYRHPLGQRGGVYEDVGAVVARDEAEALLAVEPLDLAGGHQNLVHEVNRGRWAAPCPPATAADGPSRLPTAMELPNPDPA